MLICVLFVNLGDGESAAKRSGIAISARKMALWSHVRLKRRKRSGVRTRYLGAAARHRPHRVDSGIRFDPILSASAIDAEKETKTVATQGAHIHGRPPATTYY